MSQLNTISLADLAALLESKGVRVRLEGMDAQDVCVCGMQIDSRMVESGMLFVCKGAAFQPRFLKMAADLGAFAYMCEEGAAEALVEAANLPRLVVDDVRRAMALVAPVIYGQPDKDLMVIGITGTKGKSTVAYMLRSIMAAAGVESSILGSIDTDDGVECHESHNTTPEAPDLWRHLHNTVRSGRKHMIMEVSSQGLKYDRVLGLNLDVACFLNMGRDHISPVEHSSFEDYLQSKLRIFEQCETAVVDLTMDYADEVLAAAQNAKRLVTVGVEREDADVFAKDVRATGTGLEFTVVTEGQEHRVFLGMAGLFNVSNALAAAVMARMAGLTWEDIAAGLAHVRVPGRMELVVSPDERVVAIVDYAHNELSFQALFASIKKEYPGRKIIAVFGAPGGKALERREQLPRAAAQHADLMIFTEEDPAHEAVEDICAQMAAATPQGAKYEIIPDRECAIKRALEATDGQPAVLALLAKGDETRQHRGNDYVPVKSDLSIAKELLLGE